MSRLFLAGMVAYLLMLSGCGQAPEKQVTSYKVIQHVYCGDMSKKVNEAILEGWQPIGGLSGVTHDCVQALVKTDT